MDGDVQFPRWYTPEGYDKPDLMYLILDKRGKFVKKNKCPVIYRVFRALILINIA